MLDSSDDLASLSSAAVLVVDNVSKRYEIYERPQDRLKQFVIPRLQRALLARWRREQTYFTEFWALRDVSLHLRRGDALGILGRNGAGKSTLLQIIAGTLSPTAGSVSTSGRIAALLELGSGFSPEFTGRENVHLNAALLGLTAAEIEQRFEAITRFADIGEFMEQPVKTYSSGMLMRLAFAVQTAVDPELLIVDEALAVGDARFQKKCFGRLAQLRDRGTTILFVTHDTSTILLFCTHAIILERGGVVADGGPQKIAREYHKLLFGIGSSPAHVRQNGDSPAEPDMSVGWKGGTPTAEDGGAVAKQYTGREVRYGSKEAEIIKIGIREAGGTSTTVVETQTTCEAYFQLTFRSATDHSIAYGFTISNSRGIEIYGTKSGLHSTSLPPSAIGDDYECRLKFVVRLVPGRYFLSVALAHDDDRSENQFLDYRFDAFEFEVIGPTRTFTTSLTDLDAELSHVGVESKAKKIGP